MNEKHSIGDPAELAALYASGAMPDDEAVAFERHLQEGCRDCAAALMELDSVVAGLAARMPPIEPPAHIRQQLIDRAAQAEAAPAGPQVWREWQSDQPAAAELFVRRGAEAEWAPTGVDGVSIRRLFVDRQRDQFTAMVRMMPGSSYPRHIHNGPEECLVLEGDLHVGDDILHAGDYQRAPAGSRHGIQSTEGGCLLLIVSSLSDEMF